MAEEMKPKSEPVPVAKPAPTKVNENENENKEPVEKSDGQHGGYVPTESDYEKARNEGIGNEPELPPGVVRK